VRSSTDWVAVKPELRPSLIRASAQPGTVQARPRTSLTWRSAQVSGSNPRLRVQRRRRTAARRCDVAEPTDRIACGGEEDLNSVSVDQNR
jgi:hypothetical protein